MSMGGETELAKRVTLAVHDVIGDMAIFFVKKQCRDIGVDIESLSGKDIPPLADKLEYAVKHFTSEEIAHDMRRKILNLLKETPPAS